jgi:TRAP-type C4-dicarboxylate transport system permease small subunit
MQVKTPEGQPNPPPPSFVRVIRGLSDATLSIERKAITVLMFLLTFLILLNVVTRYSGLSLYWVDESAVYSVVWLTFIGGSAMTRLRMDFAVSLLTDHLSEKTQRIAKVIAGIGVVAFAVLLAWMCWLWLDPLGIAQSGFDPKAYAAKSFNFIYTERTQTLNWPTWVVYMIIPIFALTMTVHALANVLEDMGLAAVTKFPEFSLGTAEGIN